jgi:hypothetical protein
MIRTITGEREFGSGDGEIAARLAARLGAINSGGGNDAPTATVAEPDKW